MVIKMHKKLFRALLVWFKYLECTWTCLSDYCISCFCNKTEIITYKHETKSWTQKHETFYSLVFLSMISFHYSFWYSHLLMLHQSRWTPFEDAFLLTLIPKHRRWNSVIIQLKWYLSECPSPWRRLFKEKCLI